MRDCIVTGGRGSAPAILVADGAEVTLEHTTVAGNDGQPAIRLSTRPNEDYVALHATGCVLGDPPLIVRNGRAVLRGSRLSAEIAPAADGGDNIVRPFDVDEKGQVTPAEAAAAHGPRR